VSRGAAVAVAVGALAALGAQAGEAGAGLEHGRAAYEHHCAPCHAAGTGGHAGTLRLAIRLGEERAVLAERDDLHPDYVKAIVRGGLGLMPGFRPTEITDETLEAIARYLAAP